MMTNNQFDDKKGLKIILLGNTNSGKSSLITRFFEKRFGNPMATVGVDYKRVKKIKLQNNSYEVNIWDTAGQEQYQGTMVLSCKQANGALICFDMSDLESLLSIQKKWLSVIENNCPEHTLIIIVGTKCDIEQLIDKETINKVVQEVQEKFIHKINYYETSSKTKEGVDKMFNEAFEMCAEFKEKHDEPDEENIKLSGSQKRSGINKKSSLQSSFVSQDKSGCC